MPGIMCVYVHIINSLLNYFIQGLINLACSIWMGRSLDEIPVNMNRTNEGNYFKLARS